MAGDLQPLDDKFAIVTPDGRPTLYFIQWAQQKQIDIQGAITEAQFNELLLAYLLAHQLQEGSGIQITPSGNLSDSPTIAADVQEILDQLTSTRGAVIYRGLLGWAALLPGTAGQFLQTGGAGADPVWAVGGGGGGGGALVPVARQILAAPAATIDFSGIPQDGEDLFLVLHGRGTAAVVNADSQVRFNGDSGANYDYCRQNRFGNSPQVAQTLIQAGGIMSATAPAGNATALVMEIPDYTRTTFRKQLQARTTASTTTAAAGQYEEDSTGNWRNTAAINQITLSLSTGNFDTGTVATLYKRVFTASGGSSSGPYEAGPVLNQPAVGDFVWNNQGTGTAVASASGGIIMNSTTVGINLRQLEKNVPATPFSIYCNVRHLLATRNNSNQAGVHLRNSTTGRVLFFCVNPGNSTGYNLLVQNWTNVTTFTANIYTVLAWEEIHWLRLDVTATQYTPYGSSNGKDWIALGAAVNLAAFLTAAGGAVDKYGITLQNNANPYHVWFPSFGLVAP